MVVRTMAKVRPIQNNTPAKSRTSRLILPPVHMDMVPTIPEMECHCLGDCHPPPEWTSGLPTFLHHGLLPPGL